MSYTASEKLEVIRLVEESSVSVGQVLQELGIPRSTFYDWYDRYERYGLDGLRRQGSSARTFWNRIPEEVRQQVVDIALEHPGMTPRELAWHITDTEDYFVSESSVYRILKALDLVTSPHYIVIKAADRFQKPTQAVNELWQTDFTYILVKGWGWFYLSTVIDDYSRYVIAWKLCTSMTADDVIATLDLAREHTGCQQTHGRPYHPQTQGKIERYHRSMKNVILLENYFQPEDLERAISQWVEHYNNKRYHEALDNLRPADVFSGRDAKILKKRADTKHRTMTARRAMHRQQIRQSKSTKKHSSSFHKLSLSSSHNLSDTL